MVLFKISVQQIRLKMTPSGRREALNPIIQVESNEDREERVLAMLGIIGTILNLLVIIFVYIYTTI
ncbi:hypothetical protein XELAEV_18039298mg [Xenopus laevis]|uniref:Uncharacterized protein n=1 Tax=Xenopus laevis TaxID=8355 RepID=A0A974C7I9_XENLA|nr:hypothetical protein XELAEV_18039298mg [Xenopus laevis]